MWLRYQLRFARFFLLKFEEVRMILTSIMQVSVFDEHGSILLKIYKKFHLTYNFDLIFKLDSV